MWPAILGVCGVGDMFICTVQMNMSPTLYLIWATFWVKSESIIFLNLCWNAGMWYHVCRGLKET